MKIFVRKANDKTKTISFRIPDELATRLDKIREQAAPKGLALPVNNHLADQLEKFVSAAEREIASLT